jgi:hypothetical protein
MVDRMAGSDRARERVKVVLQTMAGELRVQEACQVLHLSEQRFDELRVQVLQAAVSELEPKPAGRPPRAISPAEEENARLRRRVAELEAELKVSRVRAELAAVLPPRGPGKR